ncbi:hypothetical protein BC939DRAFT_445139 [Gamsiella multidivaricata]|uniref:uncharacterized protein n=1 Tax=Gamsiella multidivaricata TaxID=101098 RepID=UPI00221EA1BC|nr:uncharacterized protein BC939DRAFT_445139 [Gamsiella multidivaricata]KAG0363466.1 hypothetical protein BGZ54_008153 [Gamsiella multidivaricata]KAI7827412.1 hypothetical protein BC939DRAFT_445139 [Gamsiella multidivaricata]
MLNKDTKVAKDTEDTSAVCSCPIHDGLTLESLSRKVCELQLEVFRLKASQVQQSASDPVPSYSSSVLLAEGPATVNQGPPQSVAQDDVLLGELQRGLVAAASSLAELSSAIAAVSQTNNAAETAQPQDVLVDRPEEVEQTLAALSFPSTPTTGDHQDQQQPRDQKRNQEPESNQLQSVFAEIDSTERAFLLAKIESIKRAMIDIELYTPQGTEKPAAPNPTTTDIDVYIAWCKSSNGEDYRARLFELIESFRKKEKQERAKVCATDRMVYENDVSPLRQYLQFKIAFVKQAIFDFQPQKAAGKKWPDLPSDPYSMDVDMFLLRYVQTPAYIPPYIPPRKALQHSKKQLASHATGCHGYENDAVCLLDDLRSQDEEERQHQTFRRNSRFPHAQPKLKL